MLWISLHLPQLPLEALTRGAPTPEPAAIVEMQRILACDARAWHRGVRPGMKLAAASALVPQLRPLARDPAAETEALLGLGGWASQFTPSVALELPQSEDRAGRSNASRARPPALLPAYCPAALLLEVEGSQRLFGSVATIAERLRAGAEAMGFDAYVASAPTPRAATWLARTGETSHLDALGADPLAACDLSSQLAPLPLAVMGCDAETLASLDAIGARTVGDLLALPREGLARRFGQALLDRLDQALGRTPDPRMFYIPPPTFHARIEFVAEVTQAEALLFAAHRLLVQLEGYLTARASAVPRFSLVIAHRGAKAMATMGREPHAPHAAHVSDATPEPVALELHEREHRDLDCKHRDPEAQTFTSIHVGLVAPSRDAAHLTAILRERLGRTALAAPARAITLVADEIVPLAPESAALFRDAAPASEDWARLVERLRARLGMEAVHGLVTAADHRPERAWRRAELVAVRTSTMTRASGAARSGGEKREAAPRRGSEEGSTNTGATRAGSTSTGAESTSATSTGSTSSGAKSTSATNTGATRAGSTRAAARLGRRPFWLLAAPRRLEQVGEKPHHGGPLTLVAGPERIEAGWWDGEPCARDYFVARTQNHALLWVYREASGWFMHGMFG